MKIGSREINYSQPCWIVAETGVNHDGDLCKALNMVHEAKLAGADAFKIQAFAAEHFCTERARWRNGSQYEMFKKYELSDSSIRCIAEQCRKVGLTFFGTPDCMEHARLLLDVGAQCLKVGSDDLTNTPLISGLRGLEVPLILSTGMASREDILRATKIAVEGVLLHCVSLYPTPNRLANLRRIQSIACDFVPGYSDHTDGVEAAPIAVALGARMIEKHFTLDRSSDGPDHSFSADPVIFAEMVRRIREAEELLGTGEIKPSREEVCTTLAARRSIVATRDLEPGTILTPEHLTFKRPGDGLLPYRIDELLGKKLEVMVKRDDLVT